MAMTRDDAIEYVADVLGPLLTEAGISADSAGLGSVLDDALLLVGTAYGDLATAEIDDSDVIGFRAVLRYSALLKAQDALLNRVNTSVSLGTPSVSKSTQSAQIVQSLAARIDKAKAEAAPYLTATAGDSWQAPGTLALNTYEGCWTWPS